MDGQLPSPGRLLATAAVLWAPLLLLFVLPDERAGAGLVAGDACAERSVRIVRAGVRTDVLLPLQAGPARALNVSAAADGKSAVVLADFEGCYPGPVLAVPARSVADPGRSSWAVVDGAVVVASRTADGRERSSADDVFVATARGPAAQARVLVRPGRPEHLAVPPGEYDVDVELLVSEIEASAVPDIDPLEASFLAWADRSLCVAERVGTAARVPIRVRVQGAAAAAGATPLLGFVEASDAERGALGELLNFDDNVFHHLVVPPLPRVYRSAADLAECLGGRRLLVVGDSVTLGLYQAVLRRFIPVTDEAPVEHTDDATGASLRFFDLYKPHRLGLALLDGDAARADALLTELGQADVAIVGSGFHDLAPYSNGTHKARPMGDYQDALRRWAPRMSAAFGGERLIWRLMSAPRYVDRYSECMGQALLASRIQQGNAIAERALRGTRFEIFDAFALTVGAEQSWFSDPLHYFRPVADTGYRGGLGDLEAQVVMNRVCAPQQ